MPSFRHSFQIVSYFRHNWQPNPCGFRQARNPGRGAMAAGLAGQKASGGAKAPHI